MFSFCIYNHICTGNDDEKVGVVLPQEQVTKTQKPAKAEWSNFWTFLYIVISGSFIVILGLLVFFLIEEEEDTLLMLPWVEEM